MNNMMFQGENPIMIYYGQTRVMDNELLDWAHLGFDLKKKKTTNHLDFNSKFCIGKEGASMSFCT